MKIFIEDKDVFLANSIALLYGIIYLFISIILKNNIYLSYTINQIVILTFMFFYLKKSPEMLEDFKETSNLNKIDIKGIGLIILFLSMIYPSAFFLNIIFKQEGMIYTLVSLSNSLGQYNNPTSNFFIIFVAFFSAFTEEVIYRGLLRYLYRDMTFKKRLLLISLIFSIMHFNSSNIVGPFLLSCFLVYIVEKTNSLVIPIICHLLYNIYGIIFYNLIAKTNLSYLRNQDIILIVIILIGFSILLAFPSFIIYKKIEKHYKVENPSNQINGQIDFTQYYPEKIIFSRYNNTKGKIINYLPLLFLFIIFLSKIAWF